jgi:dihydroorotase
VRLGSAKLFNLTALQIKKVLNLLPLTLMKSILFKEASLINRGTIYTADLLVKGHRIERIDSSIEAEPGTTIVPAGGKYLMPGIIDDQVHFREPGLEQKGSIYTESRAAIAVV